LNWPFNRLH